MHSDPVKNLLINDPKYLIDQELWIKHGSLVFH